ncbi:uncharacterized protein LOC119781790 [Cyprinodon tularosa]|uniref:uncharacterized protein LOC119781790 n=1 Tax=Cyprinodon tularosa TaxID=77115 RepID=UPI0018E1ED64|nr:uncharacterized protein LOC119781790 [Cyprinodon tularosa]
MTGQLSVFVSHVTDTPPSAIFVVSGRKTKQQKTRGERCIITEMEKNKKTEWIPYPDKLTKAARERNYAKLASVNNIDPYQVRANSWQSDAELLPPTTSLDITNYLVYGISAYTFSEFRNYKSLEAHGHFSNGWVQDLLSFQPDECTNMIVTTKVLHSQRLNDTPLKPWAIIEPTGTILSGHCTCMAGIAETCTHVAAMLFKLEAVIRCRETVTVTGQPAYWMIPSNISKVGAEAGHRIDFTPNSKRKSLNKILDGEGTSMPRPRASSSTCPHGIATEDQWTSDLAGIHNISPKAAVLSILCTKVTLPTTG